MHSGQFYNILFLIFILYRLSAAETKSIQYGGFTFDMELTLPGSPETVYDAITGDISGWWDHSFSGNPKQMYIEAKPGGGFYEIYDDEGNGVLHATVIVANRGKMLRFDGPLGLSGMAIKMVTTYTFEPVAEDSTKLKVEIHTAGEIKEGLDKIVESVWHHFMFEQFRPYMEKVKSKK